MTDRKYHVLVIEDNEDIVIMLKTMLEMKGYQVTTAIDLADPVKLVGDTKPDIVLMDMLLSGSDGREICKLLKAAGPAISSIPIIMLSAHPNARKECLDAGADHFLEKPFDMMHFFEMIEKALKQKNS
jgi:DNA-binding response OmpR family regulator